MESLFVRVNEFGASFAEILRGTAAAAAAAAAATISLRCIALNDAKERENGLRVVKFNVQAHDHNAIECRDVCF
jgi:hypothetical protein